MSYSRRMSHLDAALYALETPTNLVHLGLFATFAPDPSAPAEAASSTASSTAIPLDAASVADVLRERIESHIGGFNSLQLVVAEQVGNFAPPLLVDSATPLDFNYHIRETALPQPAEGRTEEDAINEWMGKELSEPLDFTKPLWRITVVHGLQDQKFGVCMVGHHAVFDGVAALRVALDIFENKPRLIERRRTTTEVGVATFVQSVAMCATWPVRAVRSALLHLLHARDRHGLPVQQHSSFRAPRSVLNVAVSKDRAVARATLSLDAVSEVRRSANCTLTDALLAVVAGSVRDVLQARSVLPHKPLIALVPAAQSGAEWGRRSGNRLGFWFVSLETQQEHIGERMRAIAESSRRARVDLRMRGVNLWERHAGALVPKCFHAAVRYAEKKGFFAKLPPLASFIVAQVTGPKETIWLHGARMESLWPFGPVTDGGSMNITMVTVGDEVCVGVAADASLRDIANDIADGLPQSLRALEMELVGDSVGGTEGENEAQ